MSFLRQKISDERFLWLAETLITAPVMEGGKAVGSRKGCPQGSIVSPILANIFLHYVIDDWFNTVSKTHLQGRTELVRYADDSVPRAQRRIIWSHKYKSNLCATILEMEEGSPKPLCRKRLQTTLSCVGQKPRWWALEKRYLKRYQVRIKEMKRLNHCWSVESV
jgi:hypothetical protein